jgi:hypothetical protein
MDLPLATPELDHDALREIISPCSTTVRNRGYSPPPTRNWQLVFFIPSKEVCTSTYSVTRQPHLSSCSQTLLVASFSQKRAYCSTFPLNSRVKVCFSSLLRRVFSLLCYLADMSMFPELPPLFLNKVAWV